MYIEQYGKDHSKNNVYKSNILYEIQGTKMT